MGDISWAGHGGDGGSVDTALLRPGKREELTGPQNLGTVRAVPYPSPSWPLQAGRKRLSVARVHSHCFSPPPAHLYPLCTMSASASALMSWFWKASSLDALTSSCKGPRHPPCSVDLRCLPQTGLVLRQALPQALSLSDFLGLVPTPRQCGWPL